MESTMLATSTAMSLTVSKTLNPNPKTPLVVSNTHRHFCTARPCRLSYARPKCIFSSGIRFGSVSLSSGSGVSDLRPECLGSSEVSFASGGGGPVGKDGGGGSCGGGGDGAAEGGEGKPTEAVAAAENVYALSSDVVILDVEGMTCGGCAGKVKRILEGHPQVSSANVDHTTKTAIVWPVSEAMAEQNWQQQLGEALANHLTSCGFNSKLRGQGAIESST